MRLAWRLRDGRRGQVDTPRKVVTIGSDPTNDIGLERSGLARHHAHLLARQERIQVGSLGDHPIALNGEPVVRADVHPGDVLTIGDLEMTLLPPDQEGDRADAGGPPPAPAPETMERLAWFAERIQEVQRPDRLLGTLLDLLITLFEADRGMVVIGQPPRLTVAAARGVDAGAAHEVFQEVPDGMLMRIYSSADPLVTLDAGRDEAFAGSTSAVRLGLRAVMAIPLSIRRRVAGVLLLACGRINPRFSHEGLREARLFAAQASLLVEHMERERSLSAQIERLRSEVEGTVTSQLVWGSPEMARVEALIERVAPSDLSVLVTGETGTGKELVARAIHRRGPSPTGPFVAVNCGAIPEGLVESELFGHARGAFSGASAERRGRIEAADGGTLFLDEIGEMPPPLQVRLLRTIQDHAVVRLGETSPRPVAFRLVCATHRDLARAIAQGEIREDLYYRIREVEIALPPLRQRADDVLLLTRHFLSVYATKYGRPVPALSTEAAAALLAYPWPGNVRELEGRIKRAVVLLVDGPLEPAHLEIPATAAGALPPLEEALRDFRRRYVAGVLTMHGGNRRRAAEALGIDERTIYRYLAHKDPEGGGSPRG